MLDQHVGGATERRMAVAYQGRTPAPATDLTGQTAPRRHLFDGLFSTRFDESSLDAGSGQGGVSARVTNLAPAWARIAAEVERRRDEYDVVVTWSERIALALMTLQALGRGGKPHVAMLYWFSRPSVQIPMRLFAESLRAIVTWSTVQRRYAIEALGIPAEKIYLVKHFVDQVFWSPREGADDMICSVGAEMRDYPTLLEALRGTDLPCHIAADHVRVDRYGFARRVSTEQFQRMAGPHVTIGRKTTTGLRDLYARSRFVVVPLQRSDTDNGITVILEAMAMGKPVICSRTQGQVDVIEEGVTGLFVPVGDAAALREAVASLWRDPERARAMGRAARAYVEKHHGLEKFCADVKGAVDASLDGRRAAADGSWLGPDADRHAPARSTIEEGRAG
jgi:glycosyltransferase involved in cell wall biosynthesis